MTILHASSECYPAAKVGGLGDVAGALPKYLNRVGANASLIMPHYHNRFYREHNWETIFEGDFKLDVSVYDYKIKKESSNELGFALYVTEIPGLLDEELPYGYPNDVERHLGFQIAIVDWLSKIEERPQILHCHDHPTGLIPFMMSYCYRYTQLKEMKTVFTIHNGEYQGSFGMDKIHLIPYFDDWKRGMLEWNNIINPMACAIKCCWRFTTVSPTYMKDLHHSQSGLQSLINSETKKASGILNGIDADVWNPETDKWLEACYNKEDVETGKSINKTALCNSFQLNPDRPLVVFIGRLANEKGGDLLADAIRQSVMIQHKAINYLVLGSGRKEDENALNELKDAMPDNFNCYIGYHEKLAHLMYAGADFLLMPSRIEPCGLNQLYALRYGTIPIVRSTGGLIDTIMDINEPGGFGIRFEHDTVAAIDVAVERALTLFQDADKMKEIKQQIMTFNHSWEHAASEYIDLYESM